MARSNARTVFAVDHFDTSASLGAAAGGTGAAAAALGAAAGGCGAYVAA